MPPPPSALPAALLRLPFWASVASVYLVSAVLFGLLAWHEVQHIDNSTERLAAARGKALFNLIELARDWNSMHGGVYVPVTDHTQPNPYLKHPRRDLTASDGRDMTMVNPAFMTRQIAEIAARKEGVQLHITSLNPIRPANAADAWETEALRSFVAGAAERLSLEPAASEPTYRYMAPLFVKEACLKCHAVQGYKLGEIRGGISVTMPARELIAVRDEQRVQTLWRYGMVFVVVSALGHLLLAAVRRHLHAVRVIQHRQEALIAERTHDLASANAELAKEVTERRQQQLRLEQSEERYRAVVEHATDGVFVADSAAILFANRRLAEITGYSVERLVGADPATFVYPPDVERMIAWRQARRDNRPAQNPIRVRVSYGGSERLVHVDLYATWIEGIDANNRRTLATVRDVTPELAAEREAQIADAVFESAAEAIIVTRRDATILRVNPAFTAITGYTPHEVIGKTPRVLRSGRHDRAFFEEMWAALMANGRWQGEIWNRRKNGETFIEWLSITRIEGGEEHGGFVGTFSDITKRKEAEELMEHKASHDALTDLPNRALFRDRLHSALSAARRYQRSIGLLYIDLDFFKEVNDQMGHAAGDSLLIEAAHRLIAAVRDSDTVARLGGDEFAVVLAEVKSTLEAEEVAQRIVAAIQKPFELNEGTARVSASIGVAIFPEHGADAEMLQKGADVALYAVKEGGRNGYRVYSPLLRRV